LKHAVVRDWLATVETIEAVFILFEHQEKCNGYHISYNVETHFAVVERIHILIDPTSNTQRNRDENHHVQNLPFMVFILLIFPGF
jgi:hypothetical protein